MKPRFSALFLYLPLVFALQARATVLPDACGDDKIKFDVSTKSKQPPPAAPADGKAQIVFIENENHMLAHSCTLPSARLGRSLGRRQQQQLLLRGDGGPGGSSSLRQLAIGAAHAEEEHRCGELHRGAG